MHDLKPDDILILVNDKEWGTCKGSVYRFKNWVIGTKRLSLEGVKVKYKVADIIPYNRGTECYISQIGTALMPLSKFNRLARIYYGIDTLK